MIDQALTVRRVCFLSGATKDDALDELVALLAQSSGIHDIEELREAVRKRESLMSTGIGMGIGVPHVRLESVDAITMAVGIKADGLSDYAALDDEPVKIIAMIAARKSQHQEYIRLLARVVETLKAPGARQAILNSDSPEAAYHILAGK